MMSMNTDKKQMQANANTIKPLQNKGLGDISRPLKVSKKGKGYYMKTLNKEKARKVMQACANSRWIKTTAKQRHEIGLRLALARKAKKEALSII
jgi:hypothetical protein